MHLLTWLLAIIFGISHPFGATLTTVNGSDLITNFPTIYNANNNALNTAKLELSDYYASTSKPNLATVGTLTTGTWNASTIGVPYGGTGSTTLAAHYLLVGNGTGMLSNIPAGTSGQFLKSNGNGVDPSWSPSTIDQTANYSWTGMHNFTLQASVQASSTYATSTNLWTTTQTFTSLTSSILKTDGVGKVVAASSGTDYSAPEYAYATTTSTSASGSGVYATSTGFFTIPAGKMTASSTIDVFANVSCADGATGGKNCNFILRDSAGVTMVSCNVSTNSAVTNNFLFQVKVIPTSSSAQVSVANASLDDWGSGSGGTAIGASCTGSSSINLTNAFTPALVANSTAANTTATIKSYAITIHP